MYGSDTYVLGNQDERKIETPQMRFLRLELEVAQRDKIISEEKLIREHDRKYSSIN
jgi:hypothetical protein